MGKEKLVGQPVSRLEGKLKVTGAAKYAGEYQAPDLLYGYVVNSPITKGKITSIHIGAAMAQSGVVEILTHLNRPKLPWFDLFYADLDAPPGEVFKPLYDNVIRYNGQPIALVLASDFETARFAATLLEIKYENEVFSVDLHSNLHRGREAKKGMATMLKPPPPAPTGDFKSNFANAAVRVEAEFTHAAEHHNPIELFATTTIYQGRGKLMIYDKTQGTINNQTYVANIFGLRYKNVKVIAPFVGGAFGSGLRPQYQLFLCVMAALHLKRNVRVTLDRKQMFSFGHRPASLQKLRFASDVNGRLTGLSHTAFSETSQFEDYTEAVVDWSHKLYPAPNTSFEYKLVPLDMYTPVDMRAPGGSTAMHAIESTMDELATKLDIDPLDLRLINYADQDPATGKPFTSKALRACYLQAAEKFGWTQRNRNPGQMLRGNKLIGHGMATGIWDAFQFPSRIELIIQRDGRLVVNNAVTDIGTGTLTVMTQIAADEFGLPLELVSFNYGDSQLPFSMFQGGSATTASTGAAIVIAAKELRKKMLKVAATIKDSSFEKATIDEVYCANGKLCIKGEKEESVSFDQLVRLNGDKPFNLKKMGAPDMIKLRKYSLATHSAAFVEVEVDKELKTITVTRAVSAVAAGNIINPKTARSQILGSMIWGISKALHEETILDENLGKYINTNLGEYHIPVHADINELEVIFAEEKDELINQIGSKGVGEIGLVAIPAAIANAIFNATGKRVRNLPIHFDELLMED